MGIIVNAEAFLIRRGRLYWLAVLKDITAEDLRGRAAFWGPTAGHGPDWEKRLREAVFGLRRRLEEAELDDPDAVEALYGAFVNLWAVLLVHRGVVVGIIFLARLLYALEPVVVFAQSAKVRPRPDDRVLR